MKKLFLIDAHSLIHRCFHALPPLTTPEGKPIQSIYGLSNILLKIIREEKPDYVAACFDRPEPTFRKKQYAEYKAQRPAAPEELISQIIEAHRLFEAFGIRSFELPGFEADDLIATLADRFKSDRNLTIVILTGDLDTLQLVSGGQVVVRAFKKGISDTLTYDGEKVRERYGLEPQQLVDYKALVGDPSDNIKGVPGVGPKTAAGALKTFGTIEALYRRLGEDPKLEKKLAGTEAAALRAKSLVTLSKNVPIEIPALGALEPKTDIARLAAYFHALGFESLVRRVSGGDPSEAGTEAAFSPPRQSGRGPKKTGGLFDRR